MERWKIARIHTSANTQARACACMRARNVDAYKMCGWCVQTFHIAIRGKRSYDTCSDMNIFCESHMYSAIVSAAVLLPYLFRLSGIPKRFQIGFFPLHFWHTHSTWRLQSINWFLGKRLDKHCVEFACRHFRHNGISVSIRPEITNSCCSPDKSPRTTDRPCDNNRNHHTMNDTHTRHTRTLLECLY